MNKQNSIMSDALNPKNIQGKAGVAKRRPSALLDAITELGSARSASKGKLLRKTTNISSSSRRSSVSNRSRRNSRARGSVFVHAEDRINYNLKKKRIHSKAHQATALLDQFLDDTAMAPIRE